MKLIKITPDEAISLWETLEEMLPVDQQDICAEKYISKLIELKADYQFLDSIRNYNNTLDQYIENALLEMNSKRKPSYNDYDDDNEDDDYYDNEYDY